MGTATSELIDVVRRCEVWWTLAWADTKSRYRRTALGPFWTTISTGTLIFSVGFVYAGMFGTEISHFLPFLAVGIITWTFISATITEGCTVFISSAGYIKAVPLPLAMHVFRLIARNLIIFAHNAIIIVPVWLIFQWDIGWGLFLAIPGLAIDLVALLGAILTLGILCARFRDIPQIIISIMQLLFLLTPIVWMPSALRSARLSLVVDWNPLYYLIEIVRGPLLGTPPGPDVWLKSIIVAMGLLGMGGWLYAKFRHRVAYWL
jgi:ABC-type polysaccharide/polyol phosphate export permease